MATAVPILSKRNSTDIFPKEIGERIWEVVRHSFPRINEDESQADYLCRLNTRRLSIEALLDSYEGAAIFWISGSLFDCAAAKNFKERKRTDKELYIDTCKDLWEIPISQIQETVLKNFPYQSADPEHQAESRKLLEKAITFETGPRLFSEVPLYRGARMIADDNILLTTESNAVYSLSFGLTLPGGLFSYGDSALLYMTRPGEDGIVTSCDLADRKHLDFYHIPPFNPVSSIMGSGDRFHPRTRCPANYTEEEVPGLHNISLTKYKILKSPEIRSKEEYDCYYWDYYQTRRFFLKKGSSKSRISREMEAIFAQKWALIILPQKK